MTPRLHGAPEAPSSRPSMHQRALMLAGKCVVIAFVLWHMFAVAVYAIPSDAQDRFAKFTQSTLLPKVTTYILFTSQWQQWNLFAPDPIRRITYYRFSQATPGGWQDVTTLQHGSFPWWGHANNFKLLLGIMEGSSPELADRFAHLLCAEYGVQPGSLVRMTYLIAVVPWTATPQSYASWQSWNYPFSEEGGFDTVCPDPPLPLP